MLKTFVILLAALNSFATTANADAVATKKLMADALEAIYTPAAVASFSGKGSFGAVYAQRLMNIIDSKDFRTCTCRGFCQIYHWEAARESACGRVSDRLANDLGSLEATDSAFLTVQKSYDESVRKMSKDRALQRAVMHAQDYVDYHLNRIYERLFQSDRENTKEMDKLCQRKHGEDGPAYLKCFLKNGKLHYLRNKHGEFASILAQELEAKTKTAANALRAFNGKKIDLPEKQRASRLALVAECKENAFIGDNSIVRAYIDPRDYRGVLKAWKGAGYQHIYVSSDGRRGDLTVLTDKDIKTHSYEHLLGDKTDAHPDTDQPMFVKKVSRTGRYEFKGGNFILTIKKEYHNDRFEGYSADYQMTDGSYPELRGLTSCEMNPRR